jgi:predicted Zn-dependent peptidase
MKLMLFLSPLFLLFPGRVSAAPAISSAQHRATSSLTTSASAGPRLAVVEHRLKNGMKFLIVERHVSPTVAAYVRFHVGGVNDPAGQTGIAHLLEHMMFKGTSTFGTTNYAAERPLMQREDQLSQELQAIEYRERTTPFARPQPAHVANLKRQIAQIQALEKKYVLDNELDEAYDHLGAVGMNAFTGSDSTTYVVELPANALEPWAYAESDRIRDPVFREFYTERDVVHEERRMRTETQPEGFVSETMDAIAYIAHPYHNPVIGWPTDIDNTKRAEVLQYFRTHYAPNNAVVAIVGDVKPQEVIRLAEKYFGPIPRQSQPLQPLTVEPEQHGERRATVVFEASPQLSMVYHIPAIDHPDAPALQVLGDILSDGRTSRLYLAITQKGLGQAGANGETGPFPNVFGINATPRQPTTTDELEKAILAELERVKTEPVTDREMERYRNQLDASTVRALESNSGIATLLLDEEAKAGDWRYYYKELALLKAVTPADLMRVARKYLTAENRSVVTLVPPGAGSSESSRPDSSRSPETRAEGQTARATVTNRRQPAGVAKTPARGRS